MTLKSRIEKLERELEDLKKQHLQKIEWVEINEENCPTLKKYGAKPFKIMKRKMRDAKGEVWNNINFFDAQKECKKQGFRLPDIREILALLEHYKKTRRESVSGHDKEFLGIEELSSDEEVRLEWLAGAGCGFIRGGYWDTGTHCGAFCLDLLYAPDNSSADIGFRCAVDL